LKQQGFGDRVASYDIGFGGGIGFGEIAAFVGADRSPRTDGAAFV